MNTRTYTRNVLPYIRDREKKRWRLIPSHPMKSGKKLEVKGKYLLVFVNIRCVRRLRAWKNKNKYIQNLFFSFLIFVALSKIIVFLLTNISLWVGAVHERHILLQVQKNMKNYLDECNHWWIKLMWKLCFVGYLSSV